MEEIIGGLITLFFTDKSFDRIILLAILGILIVYYFKNSTQKILSKYLDQHGVLWKKHQEESNPELTKLKKQIEDDEKHLLKDLKVTIVGLSHNLDDLKKDIKHEYNQLKLQIGAVLKLSEENANELDDLREYMEQLEQKYNERIHAIELKISKLK